jgi:hypothetical protein
MGDVPDFSLDFFEKQFGIQELSPIKEISLMNRYGFVQESPMSLSKYSDVGYSPSPSLLNDI